MVLEHRARMGVRLLTASAVDVLRVGASTNHAKVWINEMS